MKKIFIFIFIYSFNAYPSGGGKGPGKDEKNGIYPYVLGDRSCGQLDQPKCRAWKKEYWDMVNFGCDRGLAKKWSWKRWRDYCRPGVRYSNRPVAYIAGSHKFQRELVKSMPITMIPTVSPHNAMGYTKSGIYLMPSQTYSPTDLLNMGVRLLKMDVHKVYGNFRATHCTNFDEYCDRRGRYWAAYVEELKNWLDKNRSEFVVIFVEDYLHNEVKSFAYVIEKIIGRRRVFTYKDYPRNNGNFPSLDWMRKRGKQIAFFMQNGADYDLLHRQSNRTFPGWPRGYVKNFKGDTCYMGYRKISGPSAESLKLSSWVGFMEDRGRILNIIDPDKFGYNPGGEISLENIKQAVKCGMTDMEMDWVNNQKMAAAIWSWSPGEPRSWGKDRNCTKQRNGRWYATYCKEKKQHACRHKVNSFDFKVTSKSGVFIEGPKNCTAQFGSNYYFALPQTGDQNETLRKKIGNNKDLWINFSTGINWGQVSGKISASKNSQTMVNNGTYQIRPKISNKFLTESGTYSIQYSYLRGRSKSRQLWVFEKQSDGYFIIRNKKSNRCLDSFRDSNNGRIGLWSCHKRDNQRWKIINKGLNTFQLQNKRSKRCMDLNGSKRRNWNQTINWKCYNVRQHYYTLIRQ